MSQFQNEGLDFEVFGLKGFSILFYLIQQRLNQCATCVLAAASRFNSSSWSSIFMAIFYHKNPL